MTERSAAKYALRFLAYGRKIGLEKVGSYALVDSGLGDVGLVTPTGGRKSAFFAIKRFLLLMADSGADFQTGRLNYSVTGTNLSDVHHVLFQKRNGDFMLCLWLGLKSNGATSAVDAEPTPRSITVNIPAGQATTVRRYEPTFDASTTSNTVLQTYTNPTAMTFTIADHVTVLEMIQANTPNPNEWPTPLSILNISTQSQWNDARATAPAGAHLIIDDNLSILPGTWTRAGTSTNPIVIRAANRLSPRFTGPLTVTAADVQIWGMNLDDEQVFLQGQRNRIRRCRGKGMRRFALGAGGQIELTGADQLVEFCELDDCDVNGIWIRSAARRGIVRNCYLHDFKPNELTAEEQAMVRIGEDHTTYDDITTGNGHRVEQCYLAADYAEGAAIAAIDIRHGFTTLDQLHLKGAKDILLRFARNARLQAIRVQSEGGVKIWGRDNTLNSVLLGDAASGGFMLGKGNFNSANAGEPTSGQYPSALRTTLIGTSGDINVGVGTGTTRALTTVIQAIVDGSIINSQGGAEDWTTSPTPGEATSIPPTYTAASQGVAAGL